MAPYGALVRSRKRPLAIGAASLPKRYRYAYMAGNYAWRNRGKIAYAARKIGRAYKKYKARQKFSTRNIGMPRGGTSKRHTLRDFINQRNSRELYQLDLLSIEKNQSTNAIDNRERDTIWVGGTKLCFEIKNNSRVPGIFSWAILSPKASNTINETDFFRGTGDRRGIDFNDTLSSNDFNCRSINTDKYVVVKHKKFILGQVNTPSAVEVPGQQPPDYTSQASRENYRVNKVWIGIRRQFRYQSNVPVPQVEGRSYFFVYWFDHILQPGATPGVPGTFTIQERHVTYFKDVN